MLISMMPVVWKLDAETRVSINFADGWMCGVVPAMAWKGSR